MHPVGRALAYDQLKSRSLQDNVLIQPVGLEEQENFYTNKSRLHRSYPEITLKTDARSDFAAIVDRSTLDKLLQNVSFDNENKLIVPAQSAIDLLKEEGIKPGLKIDIDESDMNNPKVKLSYEEGEENETSSAIEYLLLLLRENDLVEKLVTSDEIKSIAQEINTQNNINPRISIIEWEYMSQKSVREMYDRFKVDSEEGPEKLYQAVVDYYEVNDFYKYDEGKQYSFILLIHIK